MYMKAFLQQFTQSSFWDAQASEQFQTIEAALLCENASLAKTALSNLNGMVGAPPLLGHADALILLNALKQTIKPDMQALLSEQFKEMKSATHAFAAQALTESQTRRDQVMDYFLENLCSLTLNTSHLPIQSRMDLINVLPLSFLRGHPIYNHCIALLNRKNEQALAQFLSHQKHQITALRRPTEKPASAPRRSRFFSMLSAVNPSTLMKAFVFFRQFLSATGKSTDEHEDEKLKEWEQGLSDHPNVFYQDHHANLASNMRAMMAEARDIGAPFKVHEMYDKAHPEQSVSWNLDDLANPTNQEHIDSIYNHQFIDFIEHRRNKDWMSKSQRVIFQLFIEELKHNIQSHSYYLAHANIPPKMLAQLCLLDAWDQHINEENGNPVDRKKLMHYVGEDNFGSALQELPFIQEGSQAITSNVLYAFHHSNDNVYGVKIIEQFFYRQLTDEAKRKKQLDLVKVLVEHEEGFRSATGRKQKFGKLNICVALAQALLECEPTEEIRAIITQQLSQYMHLHKAFQNEFSDNTIHLSLARIVRAGYKKAAVRFIKNNQPLHGKQSFSSNQSWALLMGYAAAFCASSFAGYKLTRASFHPHRNQPVRHCERPRPIPTATQRRARPVAEDKPETVPQPSTEIPVTHVYQQSAIKLEHSAIARRCNELLEEMGPLTATQYKVHKKSIIHEFYLNDFLDKSVEIQAILFKNHMQALINAEHIKAQRQELGSSSSDNQTFTLFESIKAIIETPECNYATTASIDHLMNIASHILKRTVDCTLPFEKALLHIENKGHKADIAVIEKAFDEIHGLKSADNFIQLLGKKRPAIKKTL